MCLLEVRSWRCRMASTVGPLMAQAKLGRTSPTSSSGIRARWLQSESLTLKEAWDGGWGCHLSLVPEEAQAAVGSPGDWNPVQVGGAALLGEVFIMAPSGLVETGHSCPEPPPPSA